MVVYGHRSYRLNTAAFLHDFVTRLDRAPERPSHDAVVNLLVDWGAGESAVADALLPDRDDEIEALAPWRAVSDAFADALCASWDGRIRDTAAAMQSARGRLARLAEQTRPSDVPATTAEGFAHYALYPEQYVVAADRFADQHSPQAVLCVGLRSIGSILAHVVAAALRRRGVSAETRSLRPRGHPFDRRIDLGSSMRARLASSKATHFAVVDEGPGLSGSSFAAAADCLTSVGAREIVLFPSWAAPVSSLRSARAQAAWSRHVRITTDFEPVWIAGGRLFDGRWPIEDFSAGEWRRAMFDRVEDWPAAHPQHERRKYRTTESPRSVFRFVGLGSRGSAMRERALLLAEHGFGADVGTIVHGFLEQDWISGRPMTTVAGAALDRVAAYAAFVRRAFVTAEPECVDAVHEMAATNAAEALDDNAVAAIDRLARAARRFDQPRVAVDGRMLKHEWIVSDGGLVKVDALDHHADDFWPGCRDIAWDIAGAVVELDLNAPAAEYLVARYRHDSGDASIGCRLPFFEAAYLAYRAGYAMLAAGTLGDSPDAVAFSRLGERYRRLLAARLASTRPASRR
jgi:hypothetical protein